MKIDKRLRIIMSYALVVFCILSYLPIKSYSESDEFTLSIGNQSNFNRSVVSWGTIEAAGAYVSGDYIYYSFIPDSTDTYYVETFEPNNGDEQDTYLRVYSSTWSLIAQNDDVSSSSAYSSVSFTANGGSVYYVEVSYLLGNMTSECYLIVYKDDSLLMANNSGDSESYSFIATNFCKIDDADSSYNCLAYAVGVTNQWYWFNPFSNNATLTDFDDFLSDYELDYSQVDTYRENCIIVYGNSTSDILHFSKSEYYNISAKLGPLELVSHDGYDVYYSNSYGDVVAFYEPNFTDCNAGFNEVYQTQENLYNEFDEYSDESNIALAFSSIISSSRFYPVDGLTMQSQAEGNLELYNSIISLGNQAIPYIIKTVLTSENNGAFEGFLTYCAYTLAFADVSIIDIDMTYNNYQ